MTLRGTQRANHENAQIEVVHNPARPFGIPLLTCGASQMDNISDVLSNYEDDDDEDDDSQHEKPNRVTSLMEDDEDDESCNNDLAKNVSRSKEELQSHPTLKAAVLAEGQEAMWLEDEVSTVTSVFVRPPAPINKPKKKGRFRLRHLAPTITIPEDEEVDQEEAQKVHVRKKKVMKTVVLLPQQGDDGVKTLVEANVKQEAAANMVKARQLLSQALIVEGGPTLEESEMLAKVAFAHATAARRLMSKPEEEPDLEDVLSILAEQGEHAAFQHQKIVFSQSFSSKSVEEQKPKKKGMLSSASEYANKAIHYLESILPKNIEKDLHESFSDTADTISTLGLKNDTFEYQMRPAPSQPTRSYTNMDLMSISSLNEILDGPMDEMNENKPPSPRQVLPVIDVPMRTPKTKPSDIRARHSFSEQFRKLVSPTSQISGSGSRSAKIVDTGRIATDEVVVAPPRPQQMEELRKSPALSSKEELSAIQKKKWGILGKIRRGNHTKHEDTLIEEESIAEELDVISEEIERDVRVSSPNLIGPISSGPSNSFESGEQDSNISRYHIVQEKRSDESSAASTDSGSQGSKNEVLVRKSQSIESVRRIDTTKSDWDQSKNFQRRKVRKVTVRKEGAQISTAPTRSAGMPSKVISSLEPVSQQTMSDWDQSLDPMKTRMQQKSIANLSGEESAASETASNSTGKVMQSKPYSRTPTSVETNRTKDFRSVQGNAGVETIAETEAADTEAISVETIAETEVEVTKAHSLENILALPGSEKGLTPAMNAMGGGGTSRIVSCTSVAKPQEPSASRCEDKIQAGKDSLINFVISPRRANIITPGGGRPFETERTDEPSKIVIPVIKHVGEAYVVKNGPLSVDDDVSELPSTVNGTRQPKQPKLMKRITGIFGVRKAKGNVKVESADIEKQNSTDKDIVQAMSDGNIQAFEDNMNAENAPFHIFSPSKTRSNDKSSFPEMSRDDFEHKTPTVVLEQALSKAVNMAEEANLEVATAPFPHRKSRRKLPMEKRPVPRDLVDAIRMQNGLERNRRNKDPEPRESNGDAPGTSMQIDTKIQEAPRLDPPKEDGLGYRVLAPTPRKKSKDSNFDIENSGSTDKEDKSDQRRITELLYGPSSSFDDPVIRPKKVAGKGVYIGDLIDEIEPPNPSSENTVASNKEDIYSPATDPKGPADDVHSNSASNEEIPDKENENSIASPKATAAPKGRARATRTSMLFGIRNLITGQ